MKTSFQIGGLQGGIVVVEDMLVLIAEYRILSLPTVIEVIVAIKITSTTLYEVYSQVNEGLLDWKQDISIYHTR